MRRRGAASGRHRRPFDAVAHEGLGDEAAGLHLVDEGTQKKFQLKVNALSDRLSDQGADPAFVKSVEELHAQVRAELDRQQ